ncbi:hypothetical protein GGE65_004929 [Skermanella aerolata]|uniref:hypothetical protein n=1 Tax=Skermanella aerolata TaxID=393310 RepID=UPI003D246551
MKNTCIAFLFLLLSSHSLAGTPEPLCVLSPAAMPKSWQPWGETQKGLSAAPWSASESEDAKYAIKKGLDEIIDLYSQRPTAVAALWEDAVGSLIEVTYSGANTPDIEVAAREAARRNLTMLIEPILQKISQSASCDDYEKLLPLTIYAYNHYQGSDSRKQQMVLLTNSSYRDCKSLKEAMDIDYKRLLASKKASTEDVFDMVIWSLLFIEAQLVPGLELPAEAREFPPKLWRFLESYPLVGASAYRDGAWNEKFIDTAYLATHIAYIPTGNHRYPIYVEDAPRLYKFHRENFYAVLEMGELDLVAEFVDSLRQYGCSEENDLQVRDGTRYLLNIFHAGGDRWMAYREQDETDEDIDDYDLVHKAWTGILGVRARAIEPAEPGTYGGVVRRWLTHPR